MAFTSSNCFLFSPLVLPFPFPFLLHSAVRSAPTLLPKRNSPTLPVPNPLLMVSFYVNKSSPFKSHLEMFWITDSNYPVPLSQRRVSVRETSCIWKVGKSTRFKVKEGSSSLSSTLYSAWAHTSEVSGSPLNRRITGFDSPLEYFREIKMIQLCFVILFPV